MTSTTPSPTLTLVQFEAYKKLRWTVPSKFFDLRSLAVAAIKLLDESEERSTCEFIEHAVRLLTNLEEKCLILVDEVGTAFTDIERGNHD